MPSIGPMEIALVAIVALLFLGPKRLPDAARGLGRSIREFKDGVAETKQDLELNPAPVVEATDVPATRA